MEVTGISNSKQPQGLRTSLPTPAALLPDRQRRGDQLLSHQPPARSVRQHSLTRTVHGPTVRTMAAANNKNANSVPVGEGLEARVCQQLALPTHRGLARRCAPHCAEYARVHLRSQAL